MFVHVTDMGNWEIHTQVLIGRPGGLYRRPCSRLERDIKIKAVSYTYREEGGGRFPRKCVTVTPTYKGSARD